MSFLPQMEDTYSLGLCGFGNVTLPFERVLTSCCEQRICGQERINPTVAGFGGGARTSGSGVKQKVLNIVPTETWRGWGQTGFWRTDIPDVTLGL